MTTQTDLAALNASLAAIGVDLAAAQKSAAAIAADVAPTPPPSFSMPPPAGYTAAQCSTEEHFLSLAAWNEFYGPGVAWDDYGLLAPYSGGNDKNHGGSGNDLAIYTPAQVVLMNGGGVQLNTVPGNTTGVNPTGAYTWMSGCLTSKNTLPPSKWYVQVKAKRPNSAAGMWPADWFLPANGAQELDGYEGGWLGAQPNQQGHSDTFAASGQVQAVWPVPADMSADYHIYGYEYVPGNNGTFTVWVDGVQVYKFNGALSTQLYYIFLQTQVAGPPTAGWHTTGGKVSQSAEYAELQVYA
jgi:hypothetical protein